MSINNKYTSPASPDISAGQSDLGNSSIEVLLSDDQDPTHWESGCLWLPWSDKGHTTSSLNNADNARQYGPVVENDSNKTTGLKHLLQTKGKQILQRLLFLPPLEGAPR